MQESHGEPRLHFSLQDARKHILGTYVVILRAQGYNILSSPTWLTRNRWPVSFFHLSTTDVTAGHGSIDGINLKFRFPYTVIIGM